MCTSLVAIYLYITVYRLLLQSSWDSPETCLKRKSIQGFPIHSPQTQVVGLVTQVTQTQHVQMLVKIKIDLQLKPN